MHKAAHKAIRHYVKQHDQLSLAEGIDMPVVTATVATLVPLMQWLYEHDQVQAHCLIDLCVVDYLHYGHDEWLGETATATGFDRARNRLENRDDFQDTPGRFVVVYHVLSLSHNLRYRIRVPLEDVTTMVPSVTAIWPNANWYEREAFDLYGVRFAGHPALRRILTDYGFVGYPMRKDFPLVGQVEMRYDATLARCLYEPVQINNRVSVPKVIRKNDQRHNTSES